MAEHQSHLISHISNANRESMMMEKSIPVNQVADVKFFITERKAKIAMTCQIKFPSNVFVSSAVKGSAFLPAFLFAKYNLSLVSKGST